MEVVLLQKIVFCGVIAENHLANNKEGGQPQPRKGQLLIIAALCRSASVGVSEWLVD